MMRNRTRSSAIDIKRLCNILKKSKLVGRVIHNFYRTYRQLPGNSVSTRFVNTTEYEIISFIFLERHLLRCTEHATCLHIRPYRPPRDIYHKYMTLIVQKTITIKDQYVGVFIRWKTNKIIITDKTTFKRDKVYSFKIIANKYEAL